MKLSKLENSILKDFTCYHIVLFTDNNKPGQDYSNAYKTEKNATKAAQQLINTGNYSNVMLRRNEVISQIPYIEDYSINSPIIEFLKDGSIRRFKK